MIDSRGKNRPISCVHRIERPETVNFLLFLLFLLKKAAQSRGFQGVTTIGTGNEENNPMYQINVNLGFRYKTAQLSFEKKF